jgi:transcriptional regulator with XRE-family HTH domain
MKHELDLDRLVRQRIRGLRQARGWTLEALAARCHLSPSNLSRIETGHRRIALDQLVPIAAALGTTLDELIESDHDDNVVIRPQASSTGAVTTWLLSRERATNGVTVAKMRITPERPTGPDDMVVHPGRDWFTVLSGTARLRLGERTVLVHEGDAAEFSTMTPHVIGAQGGPVEILTVLDHDGERSHLRHVGDARAETGAADPPGADEGQPTTRC